MKAFQLMVFMLLFNFSIFIIGGLHIYNMSAEYDPTIDNAHGDDYNLTKYISKDNPASILTSSFVGSLVLTIFVAIATATVVSYVFKTKTVDGVIYGAFGGAYWGATKSAFDVFYGLFPDDPGINLLLVVYGIILGTLFIIGLFQMVRGGMQSYI